MRYQKPIASLMSTAPNGAASNRHTLVGNGGLGLMSKKNKVRFLSGQGGLKLNNKGGVKVKTPSFLQGMSQKQISSLADKNRYFGRGVQAAKSVRSQQKLNDYLKRTGHSLQGGNGRQVVGTKTVNMGGDYKVAGHGPMSNRTVQGRGKQVVNIYGPAAEKERRQRSKRQGPSRASGGSSQGASTSSTSATSASQQIQRSGVFDVPARPSGAFAQDFFSGSSNGTGAESPAANASDQINTDSDFYRSTSLGGLASGYPEQSSSSSDSSNSDWSNALQQAADSNRGAYDDEMQRFAGSRAFRESLNSIYS